MVQRLTYRKRHSYATKYNQHRVVKTLGGKLVYQTTKKRASGRKCPITGKRIQGVSHLVSLNEQKRKDASKLVEDIRCLEADSEEVKGRQRPKEHFARPCLRSDSSLHGRKNGFYHKEPSNSDVISPLSPVSNTNESRLIRNIGQLESAYFSMRSKIQLPEKELLNSREIWSSAQKDEEKQIPTDRLGAFFEGLCKYARYSKFEVCGVLRNGEFNSSSNVICSLSFDRDEDYFATAGVWKKIKIFKFNALFNNSVDIHYPVIEMPNKSKLSCVSWNNYIKNYLASTDYDGAVKQWDACTGQSFSQYNEHEKRTWSVDFSLVCPTKLASGSDDCSVKLWSVNEKAIMLANMAHISGLVAAGMIPSPFNYADVLITTTHKSLLGPRGAMIFFRKGLKEINKQGKEVFYKYEGKINQAVFPGLPRRPRNHTITGLAVALKQIQASTPEYKAYQEQVLSNCSKFAESLAEKGYELVSCGTKNHLVFVNLKNKGIDDARVEKVLESIPITANKNIVPCTRR